MLDLDAPISQELLEAKVVWSDKRDGSLEKLLAGEDERLRRDAAVKSKRVKGPLTTDYCAKHKGYKFRCGCR